MPYKNSIQHLLDELLECLQYYPDTGELIWLKHPWKHRIGTRADAIDSKKEYRYIYFHCKQYAAHRIIWLMQTGKEPVEEIDHKDLDRLNNIWNNLRESTFSQNQMNRTSTNNMTGYKGVSPFWKTGKFIAKIQVNKKIIKLGIFNTAEDAHEAYKKACLEYHKEYSRF